uniref:Uncharacterized protein n=1 Tax=Knipowitschia caucasica TaxID=637954 RepID=A0AAV2LFD3_KNICA
MTDASSAALASPTPPEVLLELTGSEEASMCTGLSKLTDKKASEIESITTGRQLIPASPHESSEHQKLPMPRTIPSSFYNFAPCAMQGCSGEGSWAWAHSKKGRHAMAQVIHPQTGQLWTAELLAAGEKWTADVCPSPATARQTG